MRSHAVSKSKIGAVTANFFTPYPQILAQLKVCVLADRPQVFRSKRFECDDQSQKMTAPEAACQLAGSIHIGEDQARSRIVAGT